MKLSCKDLRDEVILNLLADHQGCWAFWHDADIVHFPDEPGYMPGQGYMFRRKIFEFEVPTRLMLAKWKKLLKRGLIGGCVCGSRS